MKIFYVTFTDNKAVEKAIVSPNINDIPRGRKYQVIKAIDKDYAVARLINMNNNLYPYYSA